MRIKKIKTVLLAMVVLPLVLCSCRNEKDEVKISAILPLTGSAAFAGVPIKNSYELFINEFNKQSDVKINIIYEDSQGGNNKAISAFQKLNSQGIKLILGPATSGETLAIAPLAERHKVVVFSPSASSSDITNAGDFIFRNELSDVYGAAEQARLAFGVLHWKNVGIMYIQNDYGVGVANAFEKKFKQLGGVITDSVAFAANTTDFRTQITRFRDQQLDAIFIIAQAEYPQIVRQIRENGLSFNLYATPVFEDNAFLEQIGTTFSEGVIYTFYGDFNLDDTDYTRKKFIENYRAKFDIVPSYYAALGYDNVSIAVEVLKKNNFKLENINKRFFEVQNFNGVTGNISFNENGDVIKPVILKTVKNGRFVSF